MTIVGDVLLLGSGEAGVLVGPAKGVHARDGRFFVEVEALGVATRGQRVGGDTGVGVVIDGGVG